MVKSLEEQAKRLVGTRPAGDPDKMEANANELRLVVQELTTQSSAMRATRLDGAGGVVTRANARAERRADDLSATAGELETVAGQLVSVAGELRAAQAQWDDRFNRQLGLLKESA